MTTLALDIATKTGWACSDGKIGWMDFGPFTEDYGRLGWAVREWLSRMISEHGAKRLVTEATFYRGANTYHLIGMVFTAHTVAFERRLERGEWKPSEYRAHLGIKKDLTVAKSRQWKQGAINWALAQGFNPQTDDEAEALALLTYDLNREQARAA